MMLKSLVTPVQQATESNQKKTCQNSKQKQSFFMRV